MRISVFPAMNPGSQQLSVERLRLRYLDERPIFPVERSGMARGLDLRSGGMLKSFHDIWAFRETLSDYSALSLACMCSLSAFHWHRYRSAKVALHGQKVVCRWGSDNHRGQLGK